MSGGDSVQKVMGCSSLNNSVLIK